MVRSMCVAVNVCVKSHLRLFDSFKVQLYEIVKQCASLDDVCILITGHQIMSGATKLRNKVSPNTRGSAFVDGNSSFQQSSKVHIKKTWGVAVAKFVKQETEVCFPYGSLVFAASFSHAGYICAPMSYG